MTDHAEAIAAPITPNGGIRAVFNVIFMIEPIKIIHNKSFVLPMVTNIEPLAPREEFIKNPSDKICKAIAALLYRGPNKKFNTTSGNKNSTKKIGSVAKKIHFVKIV